MEKLPAPLLPAWLETMVPYMRYRVDVGGQRMHVMEVGEGRPVLLLHGNPTWGFLNRRVVRELLQQNMRLIMPDLIGLGFSDKPRDASLHTLDNHMGWMASLIRQLGLDDVVVALQDWGGAIGVGALSKLDGINAGLVVMNTALTPPKKGFKPTAFHRLAHAPVLGDIVFRGLGFPQISLGWAQGDKRSIAGNVARAYRFPLRHPLDRQAPLALARMVPNNERHPSIAALERSERYVRNFTGPAAIVWGDRDPVLGSVRSWMEKLFPDAPVTRTQAGHFLQEEVPHEIAAAIVDVASRMR